jgi:NTE family protein
MIQLDNMENPPRQGLDVAAARQGKLGIALSGGGFRAALFHIGILARLAEQDLLRYVSLISTVSGGSIIGAFYYLKLKQMLEGRRTDSLRPSAQAYCKLVQEVETEFLAALQNNIRLSTFANQQANARMLSGDLSRTERIARLFDRYFYTPITGSETNLLRELPIHSALPDTGGDGNAGLILPRLIINTTALNTGHLFQFTGTYIGESSLSSVSGGTGSMPRLQRLRLDDPGLTVTQRTRLHGISLGDAVAASCCVPGLMDPLPLRGLYRDSQGQDVVVRLVDGGVFDNQALVSLYEEDCTHFICSDASEILQWQSEPPNTFADIAMRANDILMDRIRVEVMQDLFRREPGQVAVFALGDKAGSEVFAEDTAAFLQALKFIRTDLDAFSDIEACSLMYHGYMISRDERAGDPGATAVPRVEPGEDSRWQFTRLESLASEPAGRKRVLKHLEVGSRQFLKVFYLGRPLPWIIAILPTLFPVALGFLLIYFLPPIPTSAWVVLGLLLVTALAFSQNARIIGWLDQVDGFKRARRKLATALRPLGVTTLLGLSAALTSWIYLKVFNTLFLHYGRLKARD